MKINNWLLALGICFLLPLDTISAANRCERSFLGQKLVPFNVLNPPNFQQATSFRTNHFRDFYPEAYDMKDDAVFNRTLVTERKGIASKEDRRLFTFINPVLTGIFVVPQDSQYGTFEMVGPREFSLDYFQSRSPHSPLSVDVSRNTELHEIHVEVPRGFPAERVHLSLTNLLRQIDFFRNWSPEINYNFLSDEHDFHFSFYNWNQLNELEVESADGDYEEMVAFVESEYLLRAKDLDEEYLQLIFSAGRRLKNRSLSVVNKTSQRDGEINGTMTLVKSDDPSEHLFFEAVEADIYKQSHPTATDEEVLAHLESKFDLQRVPGKTYVELGRLAVTKGDKTGIAAMIMQTLPAIAQGMGASEVLTYADRAHKLLYEQFGFKVHKEVVNSYGKTYWILKADLKVAFYRALAIFNSIAAGEEEILEALKAQGIRMARKPGQDLVLDILDGFTGMYPETLPDVPFIRDRIFEEVNRERWQAGLPPLPGTEFYSDRYENEIRRERQRIELMFTEGPELLERLREMGF